ncbi:hypothetical protein [Vampirovibrio chlorellavorus]|uniref:hypothetical protein n=1 Tax=Vampirovibrio chlorellavorus TaxID=758823 RepID=UPI0026F20D2F|nr:hypothetical protein [Vampirovibrio chlorellavorus]
MTVIPNFILKRMYKAGSLRRVPEGVGFDIINNLGPGQISLVQSIKLNDQVYAAEHLVLVINGESVAATTIHEDNPATFFLNQVITCVIQDTQLVAGRYDLTLELVSREAGKVSLSISDTLAD